MINSDAKRFLDLKIYPNKSLTLFTFIVFFLFFSTTTVIASLYFTIIGAWPVSFFLILDLLFLFYAFKRYRKTSKIYDRIILNDKLFIINVNKHGERCEKVIEPTWLRLKIYSNRKKKC